MLIVFGSINIDLFIKANKLPGAGETLIGKDYQVMHGGKGGNQAVAAMRSGVKKVYMIGMIGSDAFADRAFYNLRSQGVIPTGIGHSKKPTGLACVCSDDEGENCVIVASGANDDVKADQIPDDFYKPETVFLMQMEVPSDQNWQVIQKAKENGARTILNVAPAAHVPEKILQMVDYLIVNELEADNIKRLIGIQDIQTEKIAHKIAKQFNLVCIVTLGEKGSYASDGGKTLYKVHPMKVDAVDTTGAGDAFCGVFAGEIERNFDLSHALRRASVAAALTCVKRGAQESVPSGSEIEDFLSHCPAPEVIHH